MGLGRIGGSRRGAVSDSRCWLGGGQHLMARAYSDDLRARGVAAVERHGMSRHKAAAHFGVAVSTAVGWLARFRRTGSVAPGQMGGHKPRTVSGEHRDWLIGRWRSAA